MYAKHIFSLQTHHTYTAKFRGGIAACGAFVTCSEPRGGACDDVTLAMASGIVKRLYEGITSLMDKGFMMQAEMASVLHECLTPMKKWPKQWSFTVDDLAWNVRVGRLRILIENAFKRAQEWKILCSAASLPACCPQSCLARITLLPCPAPYYPCPSCPALSSPSVPCPALSYPALPCPACTVSLRALCSPVCLPECSQLNLLSAALSMKTTCSSCSESARVLVVPLVLDTVVLPT